MTLQSSASYWPSVFSSLESQIVSASLPPRIHYRGLIGLIIGPQILGLYSPVHVTYTASISEWSGVLLAVTFACSFLGESMEKITKQAVAATLVGGVAHQAQAVLGMIVAFLFQSVVPIGFGLIPLLPFMVVLAGLFLSQLFLRRRAIGPMLCRSLSPSLP